MDWSKISKTSKNAATRASCHLSELRRGIIRIKHGQMSPKEELRFTIVYVRRCASCEYRSKNFYIWPKVGMRGSQALTVRATSEKGKSKYLTVSRWPSMFHTQTGELFELAKCSL